jgi:DNA-binding CsgD family transcriptional regulator
VTAPARPVLTDPEQEALALTSLGLTYHQAGKRAGTTERAMKRRMERVMAKLGADNAAHAVLLACRAGLLDGRPQRHGDHAGYEAHRRRGEEPCQPCREGEREHRSRYKTHQAPQNAA